MATYPKVLMVAELRSQVDLSALKGGLATLKNVNLELKQLPINTRGIAGGIGAFYIFHKVLGLTASLLTRGVEAAEDQNAALFRLQQTLGANRQQLVDLRVAAEDAAGSLSSITGTDTLRGFEALASLSGSTVESVKRMGPLFSMAMSNLVLLSGNQLSPDTAAHTLESVVQMLGAGARDPAQSEAALRKFMAATTAYPFINPQALAAQLYASQAQARFAKVPVGDLISMAVVSLLDPTTGRSQGGRAIGQLFGDLLTLEGHPVFKQTKAQARKRDQMLESAHALGLMDRGGVTYRTPTGELSFPLLVANLSRAVSGMDPTRAQQYLKPLVGQVNVLRFVEALSQILALTRDVTHKLASGQSIEQISQAGSQTYRGGFTTLSTDLHELMANAFDLPTKILSAGAIELGKGAKQLTLATTPGRPGGTTTGGILGLGVLSSAASLTSWLASTGIGARMMSIFTESAPEIATMAGLASRRFGMVSLLSFVILGGIEAYQNSSLIHKAIDAVSRILGTVLNPMFSLGDTWVDTHGNVHQRHPAPSISPFARQRRAAIHSAAHLYQMSPIRPGLMSPDLGAPFDPDSIPTGRWSGGESRVTGPHTQATMEVAIGMLVRKMGRAASLEQQAAPVGGAGRLNSLRSPGVAGY